jgi:cytochrome b
MSNPAANWAIGKRLLHWGLALSVLVALLAPKPDDGEGLLHIAAGTTALALALMRIVWRSVANVRPRLRDSLRITIPSLERGLRGLAPTLVQLARLGGFVFLAAIPIAVGLALAGLGQGEDSALLEAHEAMGTAIMVLAIAHAAAAIVFTLLIKYDLIGITLLGPAVAFADGGPRALAAMVMGALVGLGALTAIWGPYDVGAKAAALEGHEHGHGGERGEHDED